MRTLENLFKNNIEWAQQIKAENPEFFSQLAAQQKPDYLWIGCADSRVPANQIVGLLPGELFVHRNIANCVVHTDLNCLSVIYYAVQVLEVKHIIVTGHYGCGGVKAALENKSAGLVDHWIRNVRDVYANQRDVIDALTDPEERLNKLCELHVIQQTQNVACIPAVQEAWESGRELGIHGWIYDINDGLLRNVGDPISSIDQIAEPFRLSSN